VAPLAGLARQLSPNDIFQKTMEVIGRNLEAMTPV